MYKFADLVFGRRNSGSLPRWMVLVFDSLCVLFSIAALLFFRYYPDFEFSQLRDSILKCFTIFLFFFVAFLITGSYKGLIRYSGFEDITVIVWTTIKVFIALFACRFLIINVNALHFLNGYFPSYSNIFFVCLVVIVVLTLSRLVIRRIYNEYFRPHPKAINTMIYGAGDAGPITLNALKQDTSTQYNVVSFIDDSSNKIGKSINGVRIRKPSEVLNKEFLQANNISVIILAMPSLTISQRQDIISRLMDLGVTIKSVPHVTTWIDNGNFSFNQIEEIKIEDLLEREPIVLGNQNVTNELKGKVVLVTGAAGSIGSEICRQVLQYNPERLIMFDQAESPIYDLQFELNNESPYKDFDVKKDFIVGNVKDFNKMNEVFENLRPQIIYHAAAYKHVPLMENFPYEAVFVNVFGTKIVADLAIQYGAEKFVMVSTDKAVNPTNVMGATKRIAEIYTQSRNSKTKFVTTRFGNVLGSNGSVIPLFRKQLEAGGPLTVTHPKIIRYFMLIPEACKLVLEAGTHGKGGEIFVFDMGEPVLIADLAKRMIQLSGAKNVEIKYTGLREGEKLYEEVLNEKENTKPSFHEKIRIAEVRSYEYEEAQQSITELYQISAAYDDMNTVRKMKEIVPEYISKHSRYEALDQK